MGGTMPLIWGFDQRHARAADWHDGQFANSKHARIARRAVLHRSRVPDAAQRFLGDAPQSRDPIRIEEDDGPRISSATPWSVEDARKRACVCVCCAASGARGRNYPNPYHPFGGASDCWISLKAGSASQAAACAASAG